jgi:HK97 family phage portal protein
MGIFEKIYTKLNPAQPQIKNEEPGGGRTTKDPYTLSQAYREIAVVNRIVNLWVDAAAEVTYDVKDRLGFTAYATNVQQSKLRSLLNHRPNPFMDISTFKRLLFLDFIMEGSAFIYWDGSALYHIPAANVEVVLDKKKYINHFKYGKTEFKPNEIIYIKDNAYYGQSVTASGFGRLSSCLDDIKRLKKLAEFKEKFYDNGAVIGLVIETDQLLSKKHKQRYEEETAIRYNPRTGKTNVLVLDAGFKAKPITTNGFKDLGTTEDQKNLTKNVCTAMGVPEILLDSGNNANLRPNIDLLYSMSIIPNIKKFESAIEFFFGLDIKPMTDEIMALSPDRKALAEYVTSIVNNGIATGDEGRAILRMEPIGSDEMTKIRIPQNISGSATGVSGQEGGKPAAEGDNNE